MPAAAVFWSRAESFAGFGDLARKLGHDPLPMLQRFGLPPQVLTDPELRVPFASLCGVLETSAREWRCEDFGLRLGQIQKMGILGPVSLVARLADTVGDAAQALTDNITAHSTGFDLQLNRGDAERRLPAVVSYSVRPGAGGGRQILELSMALVRTVFETVAGIPHLRPTRVSFACEPPADPLPARRLFGCPVTYRAECTELVLDAAILLRRTAIHDPAIGPLVRGFLDKLQAERGDDIVGLTRTLIGRLLSTGRCTQAVVADCLKLEPRTLQRRLQARGETFSSLLDAHRRTLAVELLHRESLPLVQVADTLGYADQSVFNQAFRRWTGTSPGKFRAAARTAGGSANP